MTTKAEAICAERIAAGFEPSTGAMLGHGERRHTGASFYVHLVKWWKAPEKNYWGMGVAIWLCGNMSSSASLVTEIPEGMQMCPHCEKRR